jgi:hypothetical protein
MEDARLRRFSAERCVATFGLITTTVDAVALLVRLIVFVTTARVSLRVSQDRRAAVQWEPARTLIATAKTAALAETSAAQACRVRVECARPILRLESRRWAP